MKIKMKTDRLVAILCVVLAFEIFFLVGIFVLQPPTKIVTQTVEKLVYVNQTPLVNSLSGISDSVYGIGIYEDNTTGELVEIKFTLTPGSGRNLVDATYHTYGMDIQDSLYTMRRFTEGYTGVSLNAYDIYLRVFATAHSVQGTSGSAAMTVGLIALVQNKTLRNDTAITGTLLSDGRVGPIDSLNTKIKIAKNYGLKQILVPNSECADAQMVQGIKIVCVSTISEAYRYMTV